MLEKIGASVDQLQCGTHRPFDPATNFRLLCSGDEPGELRNNCSGKHIGMLAQADFLQTPRTGYLRQEHPVQKRILANLSTMCGLSPTKILVGTDGCSAPNFALPLKNAALGYARLTDPTKLPLELGAAARRIFEAMTTNPELVSGAGRFDTELMRVTGGRLLSKGGAEGFQCIGIPAIRSSPDHPHLGMALKSIDGDLGQRAVPIAALHVLHAIGAISDAERQGLAKFDQRPLHNLRGLAVGSLRVSPSAASLS
jgi:L-asparaginase II